MICGPLFQPAFLRVTWSCRRHGLLAGLCGALLGGGQGQAATVILAPVRDAVLYEDGGGSTANGAGEFLLVGRTNQSSGSRRRSVLQFDFATLPEGALVTSVSLRLERVAVSTASLSVGLHRVTAPWTSAASDPAGNESAGAMALRGDATWLQASFPGTLWITPGGDHEAAPSATQSVTSTAGGILWTSAQLAADVQQWLAQPDTNFGWLLRGDDVSAQTAKRFFSSGSAAAGPQLAVEFTVVPESPASASLVTVLVGGLARRRSRAKAGAGWW